MTVLQIQMMLHYHAIAAPYAQNDYQHANSEAVSDQRNDLIRMDLLIPDSGTCSGYRVTERGRVYVQALCSMPLPIQKWIMPEAA